MFDALYLEQAGQTVTLRKLPENALPDEEVTVRVHWSGLNYKDALAITGRGPVVRAWPMVPGIDFAGVVERSSNPDFTVGQRVMLNGWGVGEKHWGGLAQKASVRGAWLQPLPQGLNAQQVLALGTAGFTAMLCVQALVREGVEPRSGPVLVSGATGGVGSVAVMLLARLGYEVVAITGRLKEQPYLLRLGASEVLARSHFEMPSRPLEKARWAGAVDVVGGQVLASVCASMKPQGVVTACGLAGGMEFPATVAPFILRGVTLVGIDSVMCTKEVRQNMWDRLALLVDKDLLAEMTRVISLSDAIAAATDLLDGRIKGRLVVEVP
ncbi:oxidoreductase [Acetobacter fabarum]|uniref:acrylyl-CoA reductase (NADPH) n=1 Tax=Acetobacter fabarum TaxID=483199 RepID=UPI00312B5A66